MYFLSSEQREKRDEQARKDAVRDVLDSQNLAVRTRCYGEPHNFLAYPNPNKTGCVRCNYPKNHMIHHPNSS